MGKRKEVGLVFPAKYTAVAKDLKVTKMLKEELGKRKTKYSIRNVILCKSSF